jgi:hypothetical protein
MQRVPEEHVRSTGSEWLGALTWQMTGYQPAVLYSCGF